MLLLVLLANEEERCTAFCYCPFHYSLQDSDYVDTSASFSSSAREKSPTHSSSSSFFHIHIFFFNTLWKMRFDSSKRFITVGLVGLCFVLVAQPAQADWVQVSSIPPLSEVLADLLFSSLLSNSGCRSWWTASLPSCFRRMDWVSVHPFVTIDQH